jgi:hypothetical protein
MAKILDLSGSWVVAAQEERGYRDDVQRSSEIGALLYRSIYPNVLARLMGLVFSSYGPSGVFLLTLFSYNQNPNRGCDGQYSSVCSIHIRKVLGYIYKVLGLLWVSNNIQQISKYAVTQYYTLDFWRAYSLFKQGTSVTSTRSLGPDYKQKILHQSWQ